MELHALEAIFESFSRIDNGKIIGEAVELLQMVGLQQDSILSSISLFLLIQPTEIYPLSTISIYFCMVPITIDGEEVDGHQMFKGQLLLLLNLWLTLLLSQR